MNKAASLKAALSCFGASGVLAVILGVSLTPERTALADTALAVTVQEPQASRVERAVRPVALDAKDTAGLRRATETCASSVVTVDAYKEAEKDPVHRRGAGVLMTRSGFVFTPSFVVDDADFVIVGFGSAGQCPARVISEDQGARLAILKVLTVPTQSPCPALCDGAAERPAAAVVMVSLDAEGARPVLGSVVALREKVGPLEGVLEVDANGAPGALGGVVFNAKGELVGLALASTVDVTQKGVSKSAPSRVFVLPASRIRTALARILRGTPGTDVEPEPRVAVA
jgi:S1-C subfamily serine protease